jgi:hypothetical protein
VTSGTLVTLRPATTFNQGAWWTVTGGPTTVHAATADDTDSTYAATTGNPAYLGFSPLGGIPDGATITSVTVRVRWSGNGSALGAVATIDNRTGVWTWQTSFYKVPSVTATQTFQAMTTRPDGTPWTSDAVNGLTVRIAGNAVAVRFYEVYLDVVYNQQPVVSNITPTGTVSTQQPTIGWTYADPDSDAQERWQVRIFTETQSRAGGFSPGTSAAVADSGTAYYGASGATTWMVPAALSPGVYRAYVRASDSGSNGRFSDWVNSQFTIVGNPPAPPALVSVTPNPLLGRNEIVVRQSDNLLNQATATADGVAHEYLRWFVFGNVNTPSVATGGISGNRITAIVASNAEIAITGLQKMPAVPGVIHIWAGWIKSDAGGIVHLDTDWYSADYSYLGSSAGNSVALTSGYQASAGRDLPPPGARYAHLMWRSSGSLTGGQVLSWDSVGLWFSREDASTTDLDARLIAAENELVGLQIAVAALEGNPPTITITPQETPLDSTLYRGGLDSRNLLGVADASFVYTLLGTRWEAVNTGTLSTAPDAAGYEGYSLRFAPTTVGDIHYLKTTGSYPIPVVDAQYQFSYRARATSVGSSQASTLRAYAVVVWADDNNTPVGAPVGVGQIQLVNGPDFSDQVAITATPNAGATRFYIEIVLTGETSVDDRWVFDQFQMVRMPAFTAAAGYGRGPYGRGPYGGTSTRQGGPIIAWKPASQVDVFPLVEYSTDNGSSWQPVRRTEYGAYDPITRLAVVHDYEAPLGVPTMYRAKTAARDYQTDPTNGALIVSAPTSAQSAVLTVNDYYLLDPFTSIRVPFNISADGGSIAELSMNRPRPQQEFAPLGRQFKIILSDTPKGNEFDWRLVVPTAGDWDRLEALLATGHTLLVQTPLGRSWYVQPGSARKLTAALEGAVDHGAVIEFSGFEQGRP